MHGPAVILLLLIVAPLQMVSAQNNQITVQADSAGSVDSKWIKIKDKNGIQVYSIAMQDTAIVKARAVAIINAPLENIQQQVDNLAQRPQWVPYLKYSRIIEKISPTEHIEYSLFSAPWPASDRDFVYRVKRLQERLGSSLQLSYRMQSVEHKAMPLQPGLIRGEIFSSVYRLTPINTEQTRVELIYHADPRGWLPNWIVNIIQRAFPFRMMQNLKRQLEPSAGEVSGNLSGL
jgi:hypothetical protein